MAVTVTMRVRGVLPALLLAVACWLVAGCATPPRNALPESLASSAQIPDIEAAYLWGDQTPQRMDAQRRDTVSKIQRLVAEQGDGFLKHPLHYLALSGGGHNGAFGAGLLNGWSRSGKRPTFAIVTGISTGAVIAPFAFLGPEYDDRLQEIYTRYRTDDALRFRSVVRALLGDAAADVSGMKHLIRTYIDEALMAAIAEAYGDGRLLFIGTTNLDAGRPVIWNIGRIAASRAPHALPLIQEIILASASIPGVFPPVMIECEAGGRHYEEMHVDGGVTRQVFLFPEALQWHAFLKEMGFTGPQKLYVIFNGNLVHRRKVIRPSIFAISGRSIETLIKNQGIGDLYKLFLIARNNDIAYHLTYIPPDFSDEPEEMFDPEYMQSLFDLGFRTGLQTGHWQQVPPGLETDKAANAD